jgi:hypothetical protein
MIQLPAVLFAVVARRAPQARPTARENVVAVGWDLRYPSGVSCSPWIPTITLGVQMRTFFLRSSVLFLVPACGGGGAA